MEKVNNCCAGQTMPYLSIAAARLTGAGCIHGILQGKDRIPILKRLFVIVLATHCRENSWCCDPEHHAPAPSRLMDFVIIRPVPFIMSHSIRTDILGNYSVTRDHKCSLTSHFPTLKQGGNNTMMLIKSLVLRPFYIDGRK